MTKDDYIMYLGKKGLFLKLNVEHLHQEMRLRKAECTGPCL